MYLFDLVYALFSAHGRQSCDVLLCHITIKCVLHVVFWKWIPPKMLALVTQTSVYHWPTEGDSEPIKMFDRTANLANNQIINYRCDPSEKWLVLIGIAPVSAERPQLVKGNMQLYSVDQQHSQALEAHAAAFASFRKPSFTKKQADLFFPPYFADDFPVAMQEDLLCIGWLNSGDLSRDKWNHSYFR
ncbi:hypothetical protein FXO38_17596, partial [Capsicum annuum]